MEQIDIYELFDQDYRESKVDEILALIKSHAPNVKVAAVWVPYIWAGRDEPGFAIKENGKYKLYKFWHGELNMNHFRVLDELPNRDWISLEN